MSYNLEWEDYYLWLEDLRQSGITNMFGAGPYLADAFDLPRKKASVIVGSWMDNYTQLVEDGIISRVEVGDDDE